jgi:hypothetical protein
MLNKAVAVVAVVGEIETVAAKPLTLHIFSVGKLMAAPFVEKPIGTVFVFGAEVV